MFINITKSKLNKYNVFKILRLLMKAPLYSVCICNYNMKDYLEVSLTSIIEQLDDRYEVLVIDDGSNDGSLEVLANLEKKYQIMRFIPLFRDSRRKLGETRNISVKAARGKYVLLHIDSDDIWEPYIDSFVRIFHEIQKRKYLDEFMLSGLQIQMANRNLILNQPYQNVYYTEDRILWNQLSVIDKLICIDHNIFRKRITLKNNKKKLIKILKSQYSQMLVSFSYSSNIFKTFKQFLYKIFFLKKYSIHIKILKLILLFPTAIMGGLFLRKKFINQTILTYRKLNMIDLQSIEDNTKNEFGLLNLNTKEREIYMLNKQYSN